MAKKKSQPAKSISNRRAQHDYALDDSLLVGISLTGGEAKALRRGHGQLRGAYVNVLNDELWLVNATIKGDNAIKISAEDETRSRKLLAKRKEIAELQAARQQGKTIVPLAVLTQGRYIKVRISAGRGKKRYDKRHALKKREAVRDASRTLKSL